MEFMNLEVTVNSAKDLKNLRHVTRMDVFVVVSLSGDGSNPEQQTRVLENCGTNPQWGQTFSFKVDEAAALAGRLTLKFEIKDDHNVRGHRDVGWVDVPVKKLLEQGGGAGAGEPKVARYSVRLPSGETQGFLEISYKFGERFTEATPPEANNKPVIADPAARGPPFGGPENQRPQAVGFTSVVMGCSLVANLIDTIANVTDTMANVTDTVANVRGMAADDSSYEAGDRDGVNEANV